MSPEGEGANAFGRGWPDEAMLDARDRAERRLQSEDPAAILKKVCDLD